MIKKFIVTLLIVFLFTSCASFMASMRGANPKEYLEEYPDVDPVIRECILSNKIQLGMNKKQVIASWGKPRDINKSVGSWGVHEQWIYGEYGTIYKVYYLYFENGILTSWQD